MIPLIILGFTMIAGIEAPALIRNKQWKELFVFSALLGLGFGLSLLMAYGVQLPPVSTLIGQFIGNLLGLKPE